MLDIKRIREKTDEVRQGLRDRDVDPALVDQVLEFDARRREILAVAEELKGRRNTVSKQIGQLRKAGEDTTEIQASMRKLGDEIAALDARLADVEAGQNALLLSLPNLPAPGVVPGGKEMNAVVSVFGEKPAFEGFTPRNHVDLCTDLGLIDYERGVKMGGTGYWLYQGDGARLEWALLNYFIEEHLKDGYTFMLPPHLLNYECGLAAGQFPKFEEDVFRLTEEGFHFLLPTAETALVNLYRGEILDEAVLPRRLFAYTPCYRREAGAYRASERGMIRGHQFNKVEMFAYTRPEESEAMLRELIRKACALVEGLGLHHRLSKLAAGDCSASMATTYDIELWLPSMNEYKECSSVSNAMDYQARRGNIRFRRAETQKLEFVHTLNGSGLATSRLMPAIVEQFQNADGTVTIPEALRKYMGGQEFLPHVESAS
ncbi:MAG: serine--tRNA ligase [Kiritimatiellia bacterium]|jgi:seryl-tRNA synthetase|uniref:serine--tRNA ligase n=1 Tax=Atribacter sp. TaxID=2847780 RepID=UPI003D9718CE